MYCTGSNGLYRRGEHYWFCLGNNIHWPSVVKFSASTDFDLKKTHLHTNHSSKHVLSWLSNQKELRDQLRLLVVARLLSLNLRWTVYIICQTLVHIYESRGSTWFWCKDVFIAYWPFWMIASALLHVDEVGFQLEVVTNVHLYIPALLSTVISWVNPV